VDSGSALKGRPDDICALDASIKFHCETAADINLAMLTHAAPRSRLLYAMGDPKERNHRRALSGTRETVTGAIWTSESYRKRLASNTWLLVAQKEQGDETAVH
jgi:hypothetical protein